jgi:hypothetical protein
MQVLEPRGVPTRLVRRERVGFGVWRTGVSCNCEGVGCI